MSAKLRKPHFFSGCPNVQQELATVNWYSKDKVWSESWDHVWHQGLLYERCWYCKKKVSGLYVMVVAHALSVPSSHCHAWNCISCFEGKLKMYLDTGRHLMVRNPPDKQNESHRCYDIAFDSTMFLEHATESVAPIPKKTASRSTDPSNKRCKKMFWCHSSLKFKWACLSTAMSSVLSCMQEKVKIIECVGLVVPFTKTYLLCSSLHKMLLLFLLPLISFKLCCTIKRLMYQSCQGTGWKNNMALWQARSGSYNWTTTYASTFIYMLFKVCAQWTSTSGSTSLHV